MIEIIISLILAIIGGYVVGYYEFGCLIDIRMVFGWILLSLSMLISGSVIVIIPFLITLALTVWKYAPPELEGD